MTSDIDVVIVHYSSLEDLSNCLTSLECERLASVTIVDNSSPWPVPLDVASRPGTQVVRLTENIGFGRGVNEGAKVGRAPLVLIVNPDVRMSVGSLEKLRMALESADRMVAVGPRLLLENGAPQVGAAGYFPTYGSVTAHCFPALRRLPARWARRPLFLGRTDETSVSSRHPRQVDWVSGACLLVKRNAFEAIGGFDDRFFMYGEDIDLCQRFAQQEWQVCYCANTTVVHTHHALGSDWIDGLDQYSRIHSREARRALNAILALGLGGRAVAYALRLSADHTTNPGAARRMAGYAWRAARLAIGP